MDGYRGFQFEIADNDLPQLHQAIADLDEYGIIVERNGAGCRFYTCWCPDDDTKSLSLTMALEKLMPMISHGAAGTV